MVGHSEEVDSDLPLNCWTHIARQALCPREQISAPAVPEKVLAATSLREANVPTPHECPPADDPTDACMLVDAAFGSNPSKEWALGQRRADARARSPGVASWWRCLAHSPLLAQRTGTGKLRIHDAQAPIGFSALLVGN